MIKSVGAQYTLVGHSDNRIEGDTNHMLRNKVQFALKIIYKSFFVLEKIKKKKKIKRHLVY